MRSLSKIFDLIRGIKTPAVEKLPYPRSNTTVGNLVLTMHRHERRLAHNNEYLENEIKRLTEELRQGNAAHQVIINGLHSLADDPALSDDERMMTTFEVQIDEAAIVDSLFADNDVKSSKFYVKPGVVLSDLMTPDVTKVVEMMKSTTQDFREKGGVVGGDPTGAA